MAAFSRFSLLELGRLLQPFDDPEWEYDGFRCRADIANGKAELISRRDNVYRSWTGLRALRAPRVGAAGQCDPPRTSAHGCDAAPGQRVDMRTAQGIIGHARGSTTLDVYAAYIPSNAERAVTRLDAMIASAESAKGGVIARRSELVATVWQPRGHLELRSKKPR